MSESVSKSASKSLSKTSSCQANVQVHANLCSRDATCAPGRSNDSKMEIIARFNYE